MNANWNWGERLSEIRLSRKAVCVYIILVVVFDRPKAHSFLVYERIQDFSFNFTQKKEQDMRVRILFSVNYPFKYHPSIHIILSTNLKSILSSTIDI